MRTCPECGKNYDDTWKVCLACEAELEGASGHGEPDIAQAPDAQAEKPNGVFILAWWTIITSFLGVLTVQASMAVNPPASTIFYIVLSPISIAVAVFLLKFREWARIAIVVISLLIVAETAVTTPYASSRMKADMMSQLETGFQRGIDAAKEKDAGSAQADPERAAKMEQIKQDMKKSMGPVADIFIWVVVIFSMLFYLGIAYYFSLAKIKSYFS